MAGISENYSGGTFLSDLVARPEFTSYLMEDVYNQCKWIQSGIVTRNSVLDCAAGGTRIRVPFYQPQVESEEQIRSDSSWGTSGNGYLTPGKITASEQIATILHRGGAYASDDLSAMGTGAGDPLNAIRSYLAKCVLKLRTATLLSQMEGLFDTALAGNVFDASVSTAGATADNFLSAANVVKTQALLGERGDDLTTIAMHSNLAFYLRTVGALTFSTSALATGGDISWGGGGIGLQSTEVSYFMGMVVNVDDLLKPIVNDGGADQYPVYLMGPGTVAEGVQRAFKVESDRNILSQQNVIAWTHDFSFHVFGTSWKNAGDNPLNTALALGSNWECVYGADATGNAGEGSKMIPAAKLLVNSPLAANV